MVSDVLGKGARNMLGALITGERDVEVLADMALTRTRARIPDLRLALEDGSASTTPSCCAPTSTTSTTWVP